MALTECLVDGLPGFALLGEVRLKRRLRPKFDGKGSVRGAEDPNSAARNSAAPLHVGFPRTPGAISLVEESFMAVDLYISI